MSRNLGLTSLGDGEASDDIVLIDLLDPDQPVQFSKAALNELVSSVARFVQASDIQQGERVGILGLNSVYFVAALLGIMRAGAVAVPINFKFPDETIKFICDDAELCMVFVEENQASRVASDLTTVHLDAQSFSNFPGDGHYKPFEPEDTDPGLILYTSGSTGRPKGVLLSHASQFFMIDQLAARAGGLTGMVAAPLYHMNGILFTLLLIAHRGTVVLMPRFDAVAYMRAIDQYKANMISGVPTMLSLMAREQALISQLDFSSVFSVQMGSSPLSETAVHQAQVMFPNARISNGYGTTEAGAGMFGSHPENIPVPMMSLGYPASNVEVRLAGGISDDQGILEIKTPAAMSGYLNLAEKTAEKVSTDGWIDTGDIMRRDEKGFYYFVGRDDDMFVCSGENIFPGQVERLLERDSRIAEASVVPCDDEVRGQIPVAFIVRSLRAELNEDEVKEIALADAPAYMHPRHVIFLDEMPLAGTNKIDRKVLANRARERKDKE
jgi:acyl-CoA synthetase (AMP-forming)/AMP-acid ligase II